MLSIIIMYYYNKCVRIVRMVLFLLQLFICVIVLLVRDPQVTLPLHLIYFIDIETHIKVTVALLLNWKILFIYLTYF